VKLGNKKARLLKDLEITEVSLVTSPANEEAKVLFWKQDGGSPIEKRIRMYTDIEEITKDTKDDVLATKGESWREVEKMLKGRVKKSDYQADYNQILLMEMTRPTWNEYYAEYSKKPDVTDKEIQKREYDYTSAAIEIDLRAKRMVAKGESPDISQAYGEVCRRFPELEKKYQESQ